MCGIAGVLRIHQPGTTPPHPLVAIPEAWLDVLDEGIRHRGPDGQGRFRDRASRSDGTIVDLALVHRRLSVLDHAGGHQPMVHDGERLRPDLTYQPGEEPKLAHQLCPGEPLVAIVFNGCVYNHHELRTELTQRGAWFETDHSDTEVLVHGWRAFGGGLWGRLDAMHAAVVWDRARGAAACGRDRAGEKPLATRTTAGGRSVVLFASTHAALARLGRAGSAAGGAGAMGGVVRLLRTGDGSGCVGGVGRVGPAHAADLCAQGVVGGPRAGQPTRGARPHLGTSAGADRLVRAAVASRLEADVPLGVFLSGGIDSGLIAAIAGRELPGLRTFTVRMPDARYDESEAAAETARAIGTDHTTLDCEPDPAADLVRLIERLGQPLADSSLLPTYWLCKAARGHVKVALSGDGGDELFGGYRRHTIAPVLNRWRRVLGLIPERLLGRRVPGSRGDYLARLAVAARHGGYPELLAIFQTPDLRRLIPTIDRQGPGHGVVHGAFERVGDPLGYDFEHYLPDDLLRKTDTASMAVALEVRAPFLARELVEAALRTPLHVLMPMGERKGLLRQVARNYLPDTIVDRPKQGFAIPIGRWFREDYGGLRQLLFDHLGSADPFPGLGAAGVAIDMGFVRRMLREHDAAGETSINPWHGRDHSHRLYALLVLSVWSRWLAGLQKSKPTVA